MTVEEHRKLVAEHLAYIKERLDDNAVKLDKINGRVRANERAISYIKGVGTLTIAIVTAVLGWFKFE